MTFQDILQKPKNNQSAAAGRALAGTWTHIFQKPEFVLFRRAGTAVPPPQNYLVQPAGHLGRIALLCRDSSGQRPADGNNLPRPELLLRQKHFTQYTFNTENKPALFLTGFIAGIACIYIVLDELTTYAITALIVYAAYINIKSFAGKLSGLLAPDERASTRDLSEFTSFFINLLITFSVINLSLNTIHISLGTQIAFNFSEGVQGILDAIYFGLITMTTVGYGDIYPHSSVARAVVGLECLTSYVLLGIMIGIVSRGVDFGSKASK